MDEIDESLQHMTMIKQNSMLPSHVSKELFCDTSKEISEMQKQVADVEQDVLMEWEGLVGELSADSLYLCLINVN